MFPSGVSEAALASQPCSIHSLSLDLHTTHSLDLPQWPTFCFLDWYKREYQVSIIAIIIIEFS